MDGSTSAAPASRPRPTLRERIVLALFVAVLLALLGRNVYLTREWRQLQKSMRQAALAEAFTAGDSVTRLPLERDDGTQVLAVAEVEQGVRVLCFYSDSCEACIREKQAWSIFLTEHRGDHILFVNCGLPP